MHFTANKEPVAVAVADGSGELDEDVFASVSYHQRCFVRSRLEGSFLGFLKRCTVMLCSARNG